MLISFNHILRIEKFSSMEVGDSIIKNLLSSEFYVIPFSIFLSSSIFRIFYSFASQRDYCSLVFDCCQCPLSVLVA